MHVFYRDWSVLLRDASEAVIMNLLEVEEQRKFMKRLKKN
jgi:hypothetical protein